MPNHFILTLIVLILTESTRVQFSSRLNTQHFYRSATVKSSQLYGIDVKRIESTKELQVSRCKPISKSISVSRQLQMFRLSKSQLISRQEKVYEKLTSLNQQQNIIQQFQLIGNHIFLITTQGDGYFISLNSTQTHKIKTNFFQNQTSGQFTDLIVVRNYRERALILGRKRAVICKLESTQCQIVGGYEPSETFRGAQLYEQNGKYFIYVIQIHSLVIYQLTANGKAKDKLILQSSYFGLPQMSIRALYKTQNKKILVLDDLQGVHEISVENGLASPSKGSKLVYQQYGCYQIVGQDNGQSLALACAPSLHTYFILKLVKSHQFSQAIYEPLETVFLQQKLYQIDYTQNLLLSRVFSGVKLFWSSKQVGSAYPHFYRKAGNIFLHNAIQAKLKVINKIKTIFLAAQDELLAYELQTIQPYIICSSDKQLKQQYKLIYYFPCHEQTFMYQENICNIEEQLIFNAWQHKQLKIISHIIPFLLSLLGVIGIGYTLFKIYKKYILDVERARLKYNIQQNQIDQ